MPGILNQHQSPREGGRSRVPCPCHGLERPGLGPQVEAEHSGVALDRLDQADRVVAVALAGTPDPKLGVRLQSPASFERREIVGFDHRDVSDAVDPGVAPAQVQRVGELPPLVSGDDLRVPKQRGPAVVGICIRVEPIGDGRGGLVKDPLELPAPNALVVAARVLPAPPGRAQQDCQDEPGKRLTGDPLRSAPAGRENRLRERGGAEFA